MTLLTILLALNMLVTPTSYAVEPDTADYMAGNVEAAVVETVAYDERIPLDAELQAVLFEACEENNVPIEIALAVIEAESRFNPYAVNPSSGCYGLCQLNPACFPSGLSPADNIRYGMAYLGRQIAVYGSLEAGLTAYAVGHDDGSRYYAAYVLSAAERWK